MLSKAERNFIERLIRGEPDVLDDIWSAYGASVRAHLYRTYAPILRDDELEEVVNLALFRLWEKRRAASNIQRSLQAWLYGIAHNVARELVRAPWVKQRQAEIGVHPTKFDDLSPACKKFHHTLKFQRTGVADLATLERIIDALEKLPATQRSILLADVQSNDGRADSRELSKQLGLKVSTVRSYRKRALETLRRLCDARGAQSERHQARCHVVRHSG